MAHYAKITNGIVEQVIVANSKEWCENNLGGTWIQTSYNGNIRKNYAGIGFTYDVIRDAFIPPKPFNSWVLNEDTCRWQAPTPMPTIYGKNYYWSEDDLSWREITND